MSNINQGDILTFLWKETKIADQATLATIIGKLTGKRPYGKDISLISGNEKNGYKGIHPNDFYRETIEIHINHIVTERASKNHLIDPETLRKEYEEEMLQAAILFMHEYGLSFEGHKELEKTTCQKYITKMFGFGLRNYKMRIKLSDEHKAVLRDDEIVGTNEVIDNLYELSPEQLAHVNAIIKDIIK